MEVTKENEQPVDSWPELSAFAAAMRARLEEKAPEWEKKWKFAAPDQLLEVLNGHVYWLEEGVYHCDAAGIRKKAVDVANLAMMMFDVATAMTAREVSSDTNSQEPKVRTCRVCGCTDADCSGCIERTGEPCRWVEEDLCSACLNA